MKSDIPKKSTLPGFALVVTLTLMVLLSILALGLLTLSSTTLRSTGQSQQHSIARANARLALTLAIAQLQEYTGDDRRVTAPADQLSTGDGSSSDAAIEQRHYTGVWRSWANGSDTRPTPEFLSWLVSGTDGQTTDKTLATTTLDANESVELVGEGTVGQLPGGSNDGHVRVPVVKLEDNAGRMAWWTGDNGQKAVLALPDPSAPTTLAEVRARLQGSPDNAPELSEFDGKKLFAASLPSDKLGALTGWNQAAHISTPMESHKALFHDLTTASSGLLTNVRRGGFRKDLSMELERASYSNAPDPTASALYTVNGEPGINLQELWEYYQLPNQLENSTAPFTTGGTIPSGTASLVMAGSPGDVAEDPFHYFKMPLIINYQIVFSLKAEKEQKDGNDVYRLYLVADPIITFWNPHDVPLVVPSSTFLSVKYFPTPYNLIIRPSGNGTDNQARICPIVSTVSGSTTTTTKDNNFMSLRCGTVQRLVFRPGEVIQVSQAGNDEVKTTSFGHEMQGRSGFNFGGGVAKPLKDKFGAEIVLKDTASFQYEAVANGLTAGKRNGSGMTLSGNDHHTRHFSLTHHEYYVGADRGNENVSLGIGGMYIDWDFGDRRLQPGESRGVDQNGSKPKNKRMFADQHTDVFSPITLAMGPTYKANEIPGKKPIMLVSYVAKTDAGGKRKTRSIPRLNPRNFHVDFFDLSPAELDRVPYEYQIEPLTDWISENLTATTTGAAFFGGGTTAANGVPQVTTHSIPQEPLYSLAALQHSCANGFLTQKPKNGYIALNAREPLLPMIGHAIGNSLAPSCLPPGEVKGTLPDGRPLADHSYLANLGLWDDWFFSGIAPQTTAAFTTKRTQKQVATDFFSGTKDLPVSRYKPALRGEVADDIVQKLLPGTEPPPASSALTASYLRVEGLFNVNSTSIQAWKAILAGLNSQAIITRSADGKLKILPGANIENVPVAAILSPLDIDVDQETSPGQTNSPGQWAGRRALTDAELQTLSEVLVREVRKRGPFLSLADFVNRRPGNDEKFAKQGALQAALESTTPATPGDPEVTINAPWDAPLRTANGSAGTFAFDEAETGPKSAGIPGIVDQADLLTPIAPFLSVRSDSFIIRAYGDARDADNNIVALAYCEAVVERDPDYLSPVDSSEVLPENLTSPTNRKFGRKYRIRSFRWLNPEEI